MLHPIARTLKRTFNAALNAHLDQIATDLKTPKALLMYVYTLTTSRLGDHVKTSILTLIVWMSIVYFGSSFIWSMCAMIGIAIIVIHYGHTEWKDFLDGRASRRYGFDNYPESKLGSRLDISCDALPRIPILIMLVYCEALRLLVLEDGHNPVNHLILLLYGVVVTLLILRDAAAMALRWIAETMLAKETLENLKTGASNLGKAKTWAIAIASGFMLGSLGVYAVHRPTYWCLYGISVACYVVAVCLSLYSFKLYYELMAPLIKNEVYDKLEEKVSQQG